jgi:hypothetical protein
MLAKIQLVVLRMVLLLLPPMGVRTEILVRTSILVVINEGTRPPILTLVLGIVIELRFSPEILPVMRKNTLISLMVSLVIRTPNCLEMEHIEV